MTPPALTLDPDQLLHDLHHLSRITDAEPSPTGTAVTRVLFTPRDLEARAWLRSLATEAGLDLRHDPAGNLFFRLPGSDPILPAIATGSHIDAIPHAGMYDGTVGVLAGLEALRSIRRSGLQPPRSIELVCFTAEEPTRFGIGCLGSRILSGALTPEAADALQDPDGHTFRDVRTAAGYPGPLAPLAPGHYAAWVELHIEQGPLLERNNLDLGIVTSIAAPASYRFSLTGFGGHAGALLMPDRRDALCAAAELILAIESAARTSGSHDTVATVGTCDVHPGAVNSVPSRVTLQLDLRDTDARRRDHTMVAIRHAATTISHQRGVQIDETLINADQPCTSDPTLVTLLTELAAAHHRTAQPMISRAYHDTLFMARLAPTAMLFIPSRNGVSHRPDEWSSPESILHGATVLAAALARLAWQQP